MKNRDLSFSKKSQFILSRAIDPTLFNTNSAQWYVSIENRQRTDIDSFIQFDQTSIDRKQELISLTTTQNPQKNIEDLNNLKSRINNYIRQLSQIESLFSEQNINAIKANRSSFEQIDQAYQIATKVLNDINTLEGFGSNPWRILWNAAKDFAHSFNLTDGQNFPSSTSLEKCVLCQQELSETAQKRLIAFNEFVLNDVSAQLNSIISQNQQLQDIYIKLDIPFYNEFIPELEQRIPEFKNNFTQFCNSLNETKNCIVLYLQNGGELNIQLQAIIPSIANLISNIDLEIRQNNELVQNRNALLAELNEFTAKEILFSYIWVYTLLHLIFS